MKPLGNILQLRTQWVISILRKKYIKCAHLFFIAMATAITTPVSQVLLQKNLSMKLSGLAK